VESPNIRVPGVTQLQSGRRNQDPTKNRPPPPLFVSLAREAEVSKVRSLNEICRLHVSVNSHVDPKCPLQCKRCQRFGHTQRNWIYAPRCFACGAPISPVDTVPRGISLSAVVVRETTQRTTVAVSSGRRRRRLL